MKFLIELNDDVKNHPLGHKFSCKIKDGNGHVVAILTWDSISSAPKEVADILEWAKEACDIDYNCGM